MSDTKLNDFLAAGLAAARALFTPSPPTPASGPDPGYFWFETDTGDTYAWNAGTVAWVKIASASATGTVTHTGTLTANELIIGNGTVDEKVLGTLGTTTTLLHGNAGGAPTFAAVDLANDVSGTLASSHLATPVTTRAITFAIDGGGTALTTGVKADVYVPYTCTITAVTMLADQSGSVVVDIWKDVFANYPPTVADTIINTGAGGTKPTISTATNSQDVTLAHWTTSITAGDTIRFNIDSATTIKRLNLTLTVTV